MARPISIISNGGRPITNAYPNGAPMTPVDADTPGGEPVTLTVIPGAVPVALVNDDLTEWVPPPVSIAIEASSAPDSGTTTNTHTYNSQTSLGTAAVFISWENSAAVRTLSSLTWNANPMSILVQTTEASGARPGHAIAVIDGAQSGNLVAVFSGSCNDSHITIVSLTDVQSLTPIDTAFDDTNALGIDLPALTGVDADGIVLVGFANASNSDAVTWTNATEIADIDAGDINSPRHSCAYVLGVPGGTINATSIFQSQAIVGAALR